MQSSLLGWGTIQSCLFRCNNAEFSWAGWLGWLGSLGWLPELGGWAGGVFSCFLACFVPANWQTAGWLAGCNICRDFAGVSCP